MTKIAMWSGPRNISTALMRSFENRLDTVVIDEPFYAYYLYKTKFNHPMRDEIIKSGHTNWGKIVDFITGNIPNGMEIWYQKHMAHHNLSNVDLEWISDLINCILIRNPKEVIISYLENYEIKSILQLGYVQQINIYKFLRQKGQVPLIIDAEDLLKYPEEILRILCNNISIPFSKKMLNWPLGSRESDGIWGSYWYHNVKSSTGFSSYIKKKSDINSKYKNIYENCMNYYQYLYKYRIRIS